MINKCAVSLMFLIAASTCAASTSSFSIKQSHTDSNGVTFQTVAGTMRIEICGDHVVHVVASRTSQLPSPKVPVVTSPCKAERLQIISGKNDIKLQIEAISVSVDITSGSVNFLPKHGDTI